MFLNRTSYLTSGTVVTIAGAALAVWGFTRLTSIGLIVGVVGMIVLAWGQYLNSPEHLDPSRR